MLIEIFPIEQDLGALEPGTPVSSQIAVSAVEATSTAMGGKTMTVLQNHCVISELRSESDRLL